jgi:hypothetical protein
MMKWNMALCGGVGGAVPTLYAVSQDLTGPSHSQVFGGDVPSWTLGVLIMFGIGAFVAGISKESIAYKAFIIGLSVPALIHSAQETNTANQLSIVQGTAQGALEQGILLPGFVSSAMAQTDSLTFIVSGLPPDTNGYAVHFFGAGGPIGNDISLSSGANTPRPIPQGATGVALRGPEGWSLPIPISNQAQNDVLRLRAHARASFLRGLGRAFGASGAPYEIDAH